MVGLNARDAVAGAIKILCGFCLAGFAVALLAQPKPQTLPEAEVRAAVIVGILRFTSWERKVDADLNICVLGEPVSEPELLGIGSVQKIGKKTIHVDRVSEKTLLSSSARDKSSCDISVIGKKFSKSSYKSLRQSLIKSGILTICDGCGDDIAEDSMINLVLVNQRVNFEVNLGQTKSARIRLDSSLLELAAEVRR